MSDQSVEEGPILSLRSTFRPVGANEVEATRVMLGYEPVILIRFDDKSTEDEVIAEIDSTGFTPETLADTLEEFTNALRSYKPEEHDLPDSGS